MRTTVAALALAVLLLTAASLPLTYPALAAVGCSACYGFVDMRERILVERDLPPE